MTVWQRRARLVVGVSAIAFAVFVGLQFKRRPPAPRPVAGVHTEPGAVVETTGTKTERFSLSHESVRVTADKQLTYADGSSKLIGVTVVAEDSNGKGTFTATGKEASVGKDETTIVLTGDVRLESPTIHARTEHATFTKTDNVVRSPGPTEVSEGKTSARGVGMTFDRNADVLTILDQAVVEMPDANGGAPAEITCGAATLARRDHYRRFERNVKMQRGDQLLEADVVLAHLADDGERVESVELQQNARISTKNAGVGALQSLSGRNMNLQYASGGGTLEHVVIDQDAIITLAGEAGRAGRQIVGAIMDVRLAPDGSTPVALVARDNVQLTLPAEADAPARTIRSANLTAAGEPGRGLSRAQFSGNVQYRESGAGASRAASSGALDAALKPGLSGLDDARFAHNVLFEEGNLASTAAAARYDLEKGTLELSGSEPGRQVPHVVNEQIAIDAQKIDVTLAGPKVKATGSVKSVLQPAKKGSGSDVKMPSMLKQDEPVNVLAASLDYDGTQSTGTYTGDARLFQGETSVKGNVITIDDKRGDLTASGDVLSTTMLTQNETDPKAPKDAEPKKERVRSIAKAKAMKYEDDQRRLTYTGDAQLSNPDGTMNAAKIELYLKPSGDELDRAEAYDALTLREQNRKTTGARLTYTADDERYVVTGAPVTIVDECGRQTIGKTLTFLKATDNIVVDGNQQIRTQTKGGGKCTS